MESIPVYAFYNCSSLESITLPSTLKTIITSSFRFTKKLTSITIPEGVESIESGAFAYSGLTSVSLPLSATAINDYAFEGCPSTLTISCHEDSYAANFAASKNYATVLEPHAGQSLPAVPASCTTDGLTEGSQCTICQKMLVEQNVIPATGHSYGEPVFTWAEDGSSCGVSFTCGTCSDLQNPEATLSSEVVAEPDCITPGQTQYTATVEFGVEEIADPENPENVTTVPKTYQDEIILTDIPALGHTEVTIPGFEPTCTEPGVMDCIFCEVCGEELQPAAEIPAPGHGEAVTLEALEPTCTEDGYTQEISCPVCKEVLTASEPIGRLGHTEYVSAEEIAPDCVNTGMSEEISCSVCGEVVVPAQETPSLGHTPETDAPVAPDCITPGLTEGSHCSVCSAVLTAQEMIPALGHTPETDEAVAPTDRETGLTEGSHCSVCDEILVAQEIIPANFSWDGDTATAYNGSAADVIIPDGTAALGNTLFKNNTAITSVRVPESVTAIGTQTFFGCTALTDVWLPDHLSSIGAQTFYNVKAKFHVSADGATAVALSYRGIPFTMADGMTLRYRVTSATGTPSAVWLVACENEAESIVLPERINDILLTEIHTKAFASCTGLKEILIPASVTSIAADAFDGVEASLLIRSAANAYAREWAETYHYSWKHSQHAALVPYGVYQPATRDSHGLSLGLKCSECDEAIVEATRIETSEALILPASTLEIADEAFAGSPAKQLTLPDGMLSIGSKVFANCRQLLLVNIPASVTFIADDAFAGSDSVVLVVNASHSYAIAWADEHGIPVYVMD